MAGSSEEREVVSGYHAGAGSDTDTDDEDARYYLQPASSVASHGTVTITDAAAPAAAVATAGFPCPVCRREFTSWKAVGSHMKAHAQAAKAEDKVSVAAVASTGGASNVEEVGDSVSVANVAAEPKISDDTTATPVLSAGSNNPVLNGASGSSSSVEPSQTAAPQQEPVATPPPAAPQQAATFIPLMVPAHHHQQKGPAGPGRGFSCKECGRWFPTHQGLGGHAAGHKNRRLAAEAAAAVAAGIDPQEHLAGRGVPGKVHTCKHCGAEYKSGVSLGGHMRKHYNGKPIVPRKRARLLCLPELALGPPLQPAPPAAPAPVTLRLFGVTIQAPKADEEEEPRVEDEQ
jgi:hypothetical protein